MQSKAKKTTVPAPVVDVDPERLQSAMKLFSDALEDKVAHNDDDTPAVKPVLDNRFRAWQRKHLNPGAPGFDIDSGSLNVALDFTDYPHLHAFLCRRAAEEFRPVANQLLFWVDRIYQADKAAA